MEILMINIKAISDKFLDDLYLGIEHGDENHRQWLRNKLDEWKPRLLEDMCTVSAAAAACEHILDD
jgi:hypothetical protein